MDGEVIIIGLGILLGLYILNAGRRSESKTKTSKSRSRIPRDPEERSFNEALEADREILNARKKAAEKQAQTGEDLGFPAWFYEEPSEAQLKRLKEDGVPRSMLKKLTKGGASDLIGIMCGPEDENLEALRFFKAWDPSLSQTAVRERLRVIFLSEENSERWRTRPPTTTMKAFAAAYELKLPTKANIETASKAIDEFIGEDEIKSDALDCIDSIIDELDDADIRRDDLEIRKPTQRSIVQAFKDIGREEIEAGDVTVDVVAEALLERNPALRI